MRFSFDRILPHRGCHSRSGSAFSLIEVLVTVFLIGIVATVAYVATGSIANVTKGEKLRSDVATLNSAIDTYIANGGTLDGISTAPEVLAKLKTSREQNDARRHTGGPSGRMIDPRIVAIPVTASESQLRAVYDSGTRRFDVVNAGEGVRFDLDSSLNEINISHEARIKGTVVYSGSDSWVWDYNNSLTNPRNLPNTTQIPVSKAPADSLPPTALPPDPVQEPTPEPPVATPPADPRTPLTTPTLDPPGGYFPSGVFPIAVTIRNLPDPTIGRAEFATQFNNVWSHWKEYSGQTLSVPHGGSVWARAIAVDTANYRDSAQAHGYYSKPTPPKLPTPIFSLPGGSYPRDSYPLAVSLNNLPDTGVADAHYRIDSGAWTPYSSSISVNKNQILSAHYVSRDLDSYESSSIRSDFYYPVATDLSGTVEGAFQNPAGGPTLIHEIKDKGAFFSHGDPKINLGGEIVDAGEPNTLRFTPRDFSSIGPSKAFKIGELAYHNGTTFNDSHANGVQLLVKIALADPAQAIEFALNFELVNTENTGDARSSADYVRITNLTQNIGLAIDGVNYSLVLEFGGADSFGFSTSNEFHVYEGATGTGSINGTFYANP